MRWLLALPLLLVGCDGETPRDHCSAFALLTYATPWGDGYGRIKTEKICIVAIKPLER